MVKISVLTRRGITLAVLWFGLSLSGAQAQPVGPEALLAQRMAVLDERLQLDAQQAEMIAEIQKHGLYELALLIEEFKASSSKLERLSLLREAAQLRDDMRGQMAPILAPQQLAELDAMMAEETSALRAQLAANR